MQSMNTLRQQPELASELEGLRVDLTRLIKEYGVTSEDGRVAAIVLPDGAPGRITYIKAANDGGVEALSWDPDSRENLRGFRIQTHGRSDISTEGRLAKIATFKANLEAFLGTSDREAIIKKTQDFIANCEEA